LGYNILMKKLTTKKNTNNEIRNALKSLLDSGEICVDGAVWLKLKADREFKVSPKGLKGDYDTHSYFVSFDELEDQFPDK